MNIKLLILTFILMILASCNVAEQGPVEEEDTTVKSGSTTVADMMNQTVYFNEATEEVQEGTTTVFVRLNREGSNIINNQTVKLKLLGNADSNDFTAITDESNNPLTIDSNGEFEISFTNDHQDVALKIVLSEDTAYELDEKLNLTILQNGYDYSVKSPSAFSITIENDDNIPTVSIGTLATSGSANEGTTGFSDSGNMAVTLSNPSYLPITIPIYAGSNSTADSSDYTNLTSTITFPAYDNTGQVISVDLNNDSFYELDEVLDIRLGTPINAALHATLNNYQLTINELNPQPTFAFGADVSCNEDGDINGTAGTDYCDITLTLNTDYIQQDIYVPFTISIPDVANDKVFKNVDYLVSQNYFHFQAPSPFSSATGAALTSTIKVVGLNDLIYEDDERITITVADVTGQALVDAGNNDINIDILDDETNPSIQFNTANYITQEGVTFYLPLVLANAADEDISFNFSIAGGSTATTGTDHSLTATSYTVPAGVTNYSIPILMYNDAILDQNETIDITIDSITSTFGTIGGTNNSVITIKESGSLPTITFDSNLQTVTEGSAATFNLTLSGSNEYATQVNLTYQDNSTEGYGTDTTAFISTDLAKCTVSILGNTFVVNFLANQTDCPLQITADNSTLNDSLYEPTEQFQLTINQSSEVSIGQYKTHIINITDNDTAPTLGIGYDLATCTNFGTADTSPAITEDSNTVQSMTFCLSAASGQDVVVNYKQASGATYGPIEGTDFDFLDQSGSVVIKEGDTSATVTFIAYSDNLYEANGGTLSPNDEDLIVEVDSGTGYTADTVGIVTYPISDEYGAPPKLTIAGADGSITVNENDITSVTFQLEYPTAEPLTFNYTVDDDTACANCATIYTSASDWYDSGAVSTNITYDTTSVAGNLLITFDDTSFPPTGDITITNPAGADITFTYGAAGNYCTAGCADAATAADELQAALEANATVSLYYSTSQSESDFDSNPNTESVFISRPLYFDSFDLYTMAPPPAKEGAVTINAGETQKSISFQINFDQLYELTTDEDFIISLNAGSLGANENIDAQLDSGADALTIIIKDIDLPSKAYFADPFFKVVQEDVNQTKVRIFLTQPSQEDITYHVKIMQPKEAGIYDVDENDFTDRGNIASAAFEASTPGTYTNSHLTYDTVGEEDIIYQGLISIPAYTSYKDIEININNDSLYEGNEQMLVKIEVDPAPATVTTYPINSAKDEYKVRVQETTAYPTVSWSATSAGATWNAATNEIEEDDGDPAEAGIDIITQGNATDVDTNLFFTDVTFVATLSANHQHENIVFDVNFGGTASFNTDFDNGIAYQMGDYEIDITNIGAGTDYSATQSGAVISISIPGGTDDLSDSFEIHIPKDIRYEEDETVTSILSNLSNVQEGAVISHTLTILDEDIKPYLSIFSPGANPETIEEHDLDQSVSISVTTQDGVFFGSQATQIPITFDYSIIATYRQTTGNDTISDQLVLNDGNDYNVSVAVNPSVLSDFRKYQNIKTTFTNPDEAEVNTLAPYYQLIGPSLEVQYDITVPKLSIAVSRADYPKQPSGPNYEFHGHTCTAWRGLVSCFGNNDMGQLGKGNTDNYGGQSGANVYEQTNVLDLGLNSYGDPAYVKQLALGERHTCALFSDNQVKCWGDNSWGQLGAGVDPGIIPAIGNSSGSMNSLISINFGVDTEIKSIHSMHWTTCAWFADGTIRCWGRNDLGQAGLGNVNDTRIGDNFQDMGTNLAAAALPTNIRLFDVGAHHACVVTTTNILHCWGDNTRGQLGHNQVYTVFGDNEDPDTFNSGNGVNINDVDDIVELDLGREHTCVRFNHSTYNVRCWGDNKFGQLGLGRVNNAGAVYDDGYSSGNIDSFYESSRTDMLGRRNYSFEETLSAAGTLGAATSCPWETPRRIPYASTTACGYQASYNQTDAVTGFNNSKAQFVQIYKDASEIEAGYAFTCGVYDEYFYDSDRIPNNANGGSVTNTNHIRCWGSNYTQWNDQWIETGVLHNVGNSVYFNGTTSGVAGVTDGTILTPFAHPGITTGELSTQQCNNGSVTVNSTNCNRQEQLIVVGDNTINSRGSISTARDYVYDFYAALNTAYFLGGNPYNYGYIEDFEESGLTLNFEMNYFYSMVNKDVSAYDEVNLVSGDHHVCAILTDTSKNQTTEINDYYSWMCWGPNWAGQIGRDNSYCKIIGGRWSCGNAGNLYIRTFNYSF